MASRIGFLSDIHSNLAALEAVIDDAGPVDSWYCMGDIVGYGPYPNQCIELLRELGTVSIRGNHDDGVLDPGRMSWFNSIAGVALKWTAQHLTPESREFIAALPEGLVLDSFQLVHGSLREPLSEYVLSANVARASIALLQKPVCFIGHTHVPSSFESVTVDESVSAVHRLADDEVSLTSEARFILNPGSVGQPRDGDPRAAYGILDLESQTFTWRRVVYPIKETQDAMHKQNLPRPLIDRLSEGL
jgi:diadenosine tetraphosphatase ApaH/serine/threonine PP2A family protein phosphatase